MENFSVARILAAAALVGCHGSAQNGDPSQQKGSADSIGSAIPIVRCDGVPDTPAAIGFQHLESQAIAALSPMHRGIDLVTSVQAASQAIRGEISYGTVDKALEDENVDLFACVDGGWLALGPAVTDSEGRFELDLENDARLPLGLRDLYVSVQGDRSGVGFLALVAPDGYGVAASDVDGTLTNSEWTYAESLITGKTVEAWPGAADGLSALTQRGYPIVYLSTRSRRFTEDTRAWLQANGFPLGPVSLSSSIVTLPGDAAVADKLQAIGAITANGLSDSIGLGNRLSDAQAFQQSGLAADRIFMKLPEYQKELQPLLDANAVVRVDDYTAATSLFSALPRDK
jgi:phosphatidate phosphatase PAH1